MLLLGLLSLIQTLFLPGFVGLLGVRKLGVIDRFLLSLPMSILINYTVVLFLVIIGQYTRPIMLAIFVCELLVLGIYAIRHWDTLQMPSWSGPIRKIPALSKTEYLLLPISTAVAFWLIAEGITRVGNVFEAWDAVVSWNPWAISWFKGHAPQAATYPQAISILYSITYKFIGDTRVQIFAFAVAIAFPLAMLATLLRLYIKARTEKPLWLLSVPLTILFIIGSSSIVVFYSGYADAPLAYYSVLACHLLLMLHERTYLRYTNDSFLIVAVSLVATAALFKQPGLLTAVLFPLVWYIYIGRSNLNNAVRYLIGLAALTAIIAGHWYIYIWLTKAAVNAKTYTSLIPGPIWYRPIHGVKLMFTEIGWTWLPPLAIGLLHTNARRLALWGILPIFLLWSFMASYDLRAMYLALPWLAMVTVAGVFIFFEWSKSSRALFAIFAIWILAVLAQYVIRFNWPSIPGPQWTTPRLFLHWLLFFYFVVAIYYIRSSGWITQENQRRIQLTMTAAVVFLVGTVALIVPKKYPDAKLINASIRIQQTIGDPELNQFLLHYFDQNPAPANLASSFQILGGVPGLAERYRLFYCQDFSFLHNPEIGYALYPPTCTDVKNQIADMMATRFTKITSINGYVFYKVNKND